MVHKYAYMDNIETFKELFESARYDETLELFEGKQSTINSYVIGGYIFKGEFIEASVLADSNKWEGNEYLRVTFFLFLGTIRSGDFKQAKAKILTLFANYQKSRNLYSKFYLNQAQGIYYFYKGLISKSSYFSESAFRIGLKLQKDYECLIAADLFGHSLCLDKKFGEGIKYFESAKKYAKKIKNNLNLAAINLSLLTYRVESGDKLEKTFTELNSWLSNSKSQDSYSKLNVHLLCAECHLISGKLNLAEKTLNNISENIYAAKHIKQILKLNYLFALLFFCKSQYTSCLQIISNTKSRSLDEKNKIYLSDFIQLENKVKNKTGELATTTRRDYISQNIDLIEREGLSLKCLQKLNNEKMLGLLFFESLYESDNFVDLRHDAKNICICFDSHLKVINNLSTNQFLLLKLLLTNSLWTKKCLYEQFWGGTYDSYIHDNKIFITIKRLNKKLDFHRDIFSFAEGMLNIPSFKLLSNEASDIVSLKSNISENLNFRQRLLLQTAKSDQLVLPREYSKSNNISRNTTSRDLKDLLDRGHLSQHGTGKGTYYLVI